MVVARFGELAILQMVVLEWAAARRCELAMAAKLKMAAMALMPWTEWVYGGRSRVLVKDRRAQPVR